MCDEAFRVTIVHKHGLATLAYEYFIFFQVVSYHYGVLKFYSLAPVGACVACASQEFSVEILREHC